MHVYNMTTLFNTTTYIINYNLRLDYRFFELQILFHYSIIILLIILKTRFFNIMSTTRPTVVRTESCYNIIYITYTFYYKLFKGHSILFFCNAGRNNRFINNIIPILLPIRCNIFILDYEFHIIGITLLNIIIIIINAVNTTLGYEFHRL